MKARLSKPLALAFFAAVTLAACGLPSDDQMIDWFKKNRADFELLRDMAIQETRVVRIGDGFVWLKDDFSPTKVVIDSALPPERLIAYRHLFERLRAPDGIIIGPDQTVCVMAASFGLAVSGSGKSYCWSANELQPLVDVPLETWPGAGNSGGDDYSAYRRIVPGWYLHQDAS